MYTQAWQWIGMCNRDNGSACLTCIFLLTWGLKLYSGRVSRPNLHLLTHLRHAVTVSAFSYYSSCKVVNVIEIAYLYENDFSFYEKAPSSLDPVDFFRNIFTAPPGDVLSWSSWSYQRNRTPQAKHLGQTPFFRFPLRASLVIESFLQKLKTLMCFEQDVFLRNVNYNVYGQVYFCKYCQLLPK